MSVTCTVGLSAPSCGDTGEKDEAGDNTENERETVIDDEIRGKDGGGIDY